MNKVVSALNENLQLAYRKAIDADAALDQLQKGGKGKFEAIFSDESIFTTRSKRFKDYLEEIAGEVAMLQDEKTPLSEQAQEQALTQIVKKLQLLLHTLEQFKQSLQDSDKK